MRNFEDLHIWEISRSLVKDLYLLSNRLPDIEKFNIISQIRRSAVSMNINISEGCSKDSEKDMLRFISYSLGSAFEIEALLILCYDLDYIKDDELKRLREKINIYKKKNISFSRAIAKRINN